MERIRTELAVWLPEPFTVATWMLKSLITEWPDWPDRGSAGDTSSVDIDQESLRREMWLRSLSFQLYTWRRPPRLCYAAKPATALHWPRVPESCHLRRRGRASLGSQA